jgi:hypothetical protein
MLVARIPRAEFLGCYFDYEPGEHVAFFEPTQQGKTHLMYQMLEVAHRQHPELSVVSLMPKSRSPATRMWAQRLDLKIVGRWPPPPKMPWENKPAGHVLWPPHLKKGTVKQNREYLAEIFRGCMASRFREGNSIIAADDVHLLAVLLRLNPEIEEHLTAGAEGGAGLWLTQQKTSGTREGSLTSYAYSQPQHLVLGHEPIAENRRRFADIGGVDPGLVAHLVAGLQKTRIETPYGAKNISEKLYIRKDGPYMCIIGI